MNKYENKYCIIREKGNKSLVRFLYEEIQPTDIILHSAHYISPDYKRGEIEDLAISKFSLLNKDTSLKYFYAKNNIDAELIYELDE